MAINAKNLKTLFRNLAPYADDVAKGVAKYGDDAARLAGNIGTDVARYSNNFDTGDVLKTLNRKGSVSDLGDDFVKLGQKEFHYPIGDSAQDALKGRLLAKRTGLDSIGDYVSNLDENVPLDTAMSPAAMDALSGSLHELRTVPLSDLPSTPSGATAANAVNSMVNPTTYVLGDASVTKGRGYDIPHTYPKYSGDFTYMSDNAGYELPLSELVIDSSDKAPLHIRPHKNTALYRWFDEAKKRPF